MGIKEILIERDGLSELEADNLIKDAKIALDEYLALGEMDYAQEICFEFFGLEPDYMWELME